MKPTIAFLVLLAAAPVVAPAHAQQDTARSRPGMIGITFAPEGTAVRVVEVRRGSPAEEAGVHAGDRVVLVDGHSAAERFLHLPHRLRAGETVRLRLERDGEARDVALVAVPRPSGTIVLTPAAGERPVFVQIDTLDRRVREITVRIDSLQHRLLRVDSAGMRFRVDSMVRVMGDSARVTFEGLRGSRILVDAREGQVRVAQEALRVAEARPFLELGSRAAAGAELAPMNEDLGRYFGGQRTGALVLGVSAASPAERAGLRPGDVIVEAGGAEVRGPDDVRRLLTGRAGSLALRVIREGSARDLTLEWTAPAGGERTIYRLREPPRR
jgi:S1-C subfamily serine protease